MTTFLAFTFYFGGGFHTGTLHYYASRAAKRPAFWSALDGLVHALTWPFDLGISVARWAVVNAQRGEMGLHFMRELAAKAREAEAEGDK